MMPFNLSSHEFLLQQHHAHHRRTVSPIDEQLLVFDPIGARADASTQLDHETPSTPLKSRMPTGKKNKNICYGFDRIFVSLNIESLLFMFTHLILANSPKIARNRTCTRRPPNRSSTACLTGKI